MCLQLGICCTKLCCANVLQLPTVIWLIKCQYFHITKISLWRWIQSHIPGMQNDTTKITKDSTYVQCILTSGFLVSVSFTDYLYSTHISCCRRIASQYFGYMQCDCVSQVHIKTVIKRVTPCRYFLVLLCTGILVISMCAPMTEALTDNTNYRHLEKIYTLHQEVQKSSHWVQIGSRGCHICNAHLYCACTEQSWVPGQPHRKQTNDY